MYDICHFDKNLHPAITFNVSYTKLSQDPKSPFLEQWINFEREKKT